LRGEEARDIAGFFCTVLFGGGFFKGKGLISYLQIVKIVYCSLKHIYCRKHLNKSMMKKTNKIFVVLWVIISICHSMSKGTEISFSVGYVFGILLLPYLIVWMYIKFFKKTTPRQPVVKEVEHHEFREKTKLKENEIVEVKNTSKNMATTKENEIVESTLIEEVVSSDLLRIITKENRAKFFCFEFKKDSIKSYILEDDIFGVKSKKEGKQQYFYKNVNKPLHKVYEEIMQIKSGTIIQTKKFSNGEIADREIMDFRLNTIEHNSSITGNFKRWLTIDKFCKYDRGSAWSVGEWDFDISELKKVEKILYLLKNVSSFNDMKLLEKSYVKYSNDLLGNKKKLMKELDNDGNGVIDIAENKDFLKLLKIRQKQIIEFDKLEGKTYTHNFIKLSNYLNDSAANIQSLFEYLKEDPKIPVDMYDNYVGVLKNKINTFQIMLLSSMNMIISLTEDDRITFYEIYETFDKLNVFTSNHEKEFSEQLKNIEDKLSGIIESINHMEMSICSELYKLQFISEGISDSLNGLSKGLSEINSSIQLNNLITGIQTYQLYKINLNTKSLN
jgi:hypothetical protein